ncbi:MAG: serine hydrolase [Gramella sp.]|nr:serine hydrolase [Christiangramia sp.]
MKRKKILQAVLLIATAVSLWFIPWPILKAWLTPSPNSIQEQVDKVHDYGFDGIIVYIGKGDGSSKIYTAGYKDRDSKEAADPNSLFKIASVSKLYTALAITRLAYDHELSLEATLGDYFPELIGRIENAKDITIRMMVQHRSGIPNYTSVNNYWAHPKETDQERLNLVLDLPADFKPDSDYEYSNTNYLLLSMLIEKITKEKKFEYIQRTILTPLQLTHTYGSIHDVRLGDVMSGYYEGYQEDLKTDDTGLMLATAEDLGKFIRALNDGTAFRDQQELALYTSLYKFEHTGLIPGYQTIAKYHPDLDIVMIQFTNTVNFDGYNWSLHEIMYHKILNILKRQEKSN